MPKTTYILIFLVLALSDTGLDDRSYRLNKAAGLMEKSNMTIAEIAYTVGFTTPNNFAKTFKAGPICYLRSLLPK